MGDASQISPSVEGFRRKQNNLNRHSSPQADFTQNHKGVSKCNGTLSFRVYYIFFSFLCSSSSILRSLSEILTICIRIAQTVILPPILPTNVATAFGKAISIWDSQMHLLTKVPNIIPPISTIHAIATINFSMKVLFFSIYLDIFRLAVERLENEPDTEHKDRSSQAFFINTFQQSY